MSVDTADAGESSDGHGGDAAGGAGGYPTGYPRVFWLALVIGWVVIVAGVRGLLVNAESAMPTEPTNWVTLYVKLALLNDLLILPIVFVVGRATRLVPARVRSVVQSGLICTAIVTVFAYPFVRRFGAAPGNPTILPRNYTVGLVAVLGFVWLVTGVLAALRWRRTAGVAILGHDVALRANDGSVK